MSCSARSSPYHGPWNVLLDCEGETPVRNSRSLDRDSNSQVVSVCFVQFWKSLKFSDMWPPSKLREDCSCFVWNLNKSLSLLGSRLHWLQCPWWYLGSVQHTRIRACLCCCFRDSSACENTDEYSYPFRVSPRKECQQLSVWYYLLLNPSWFILSRYKLWPSHSTFREGCAWEFTHWNIVYY